jgi:hypothetical protein
MVYVFGIDIPLIELILIVFALIGFLLFLTIIFSLRLVREELKVLKTSESELEMISKKHGHRAVAAKVTVAKPRPGLGQKLAAGWKAWAAEQERLSKERQKRIELEEARRKKEIETRRKALEEKRQRMIKEREKEAEQVHKKEARMETVGAKHALSDWLSIKHGFGIPAKEAKIDIKAMQKKLAAEKLAKEKAKEKEAAVVEKQKQKAEERMRKIAEERAKEKKRIFLQEKKHLKKSTGSLLAPFQMLKKQFKEAAKRKDAALRKLQQEENKRRESMRAKEAEAERQAREKEQKHIEAEKRAEAEHLKKEKVSKRRGKGFTFKLFALPKKHPKKHEKHYVVDKLDRYKKKYGG